MQFYVIDRATGRIVNGISAESQARAEAHTDLSKYEVRGEERIPLGVLEKYQYFNERP